MHSTSNLKDGYLGSGKRLRYSIRKYGEFNFKCEILEFLNSREDLVSREKEIVNEVLLQDANCLNLMKGGKGGFVSEEQQKKRSIAANKALQLKKQDPKFLADYKHKVAFGIAKARKSGKKIGFLDTGKRCDWSGRKHSSDTIKKMKLTAEVRQTSQGVRNSQYGTMWITDGVNNKKIKNNSSIPENWHKGRK